MSEDKNQVIPGNLRAPNLATLESAMDEAIRELEVRERCYPRWIKEGRISKTDARDRTHRLRAAIWFLSFLSYMDLDLVSSVAQEAKWNDAPEGLPF